MHIHDGAPLRPIPRVAAVLLYRSAAFRRPIVPFPSSLLFLADVMSADDIECNIAFGGGRNSDSSPPLHAFIIAFAWRASERSVRALNKLISNSELDDIELGPPI